jgi:hypothetical protein
VAERVSYLWRVEGEVGRAALALGECNLGNLTHILHTHTTTQSQLRPLFLQSAQSSSCTCVYLT